MTNEDRLEKLIKNLKKELPFSMTVTVNLAKSLKKQRNIKLKVGQTLLIKDIMYAGDEGGIICISSIIESEVLAISITHLVPMTDFPLRDEVIEYQTERVKNIANQNKNF